MARPALAAVHAIRSVSRQIWSLVPHKYYKELEFQPKKLEKAIDEHYEDSMQGLTATVKDGCLLLTNMEGETAKLKLPQTCIRDGEVCTTRNCLPHAPESTRPLTTAAQAKTSFEQHILNKKRSFVHVEARRARDRALR